MCRVTTEFAAPSMNPHFTLVYLFWITRLPLTRLWHESCLYMPQAGFDSPKQSAAQVLKLSRRSTFKPPRLDFCLLIQLNFFTHKPLPNLNMRTHSKILVARFSRPNMISIKHVSKNKRQTF